MNALLEPSIIDELYKASRAGVKIDLIVRGVCALRPGVPGMSDNITVRSVVGRFLEHHRVYYFRADGEDVLYLSSADWMDRNLFRRVEVAFPVLDRTLEGACDQGKPAGAPARQRVRMADAAGWPVRAQALGGQAAAGSQAELLEDVRELMDSPIRPSRMREGRFAATWCYAAWRRGSGSCGAAAAGS